MNRPCLLLVGASLLLAGSRAVAEVHYVASDSAAPAAPYTNWATAARDIQSAIDVAADGDTVLVTNGVYATGGRVVAEDLTNRVALTRALTVTSVNGYAATVIQGCGSLPTNGPAAVRCAWLTNGAVLSGFTLRGGATHTNGDSLAGQSGGGVWCAGTNALVANCLIATNSAVAFGGGVFRAVVNSCLVLSNSANQGGGMYQVNARNCLLKSNGASTSYAGAFASTLVNCTVVNNHGLGVNGCLCNNCIIYFNALGNSASSSLSFCCASPLASGPGNISADPQLLSDNCHLSSTSPCRGAGTNAAVSGLDIDGQPWANPPSMGCDEWQPAPIFAGQPFAQFLTAPSGLTFRSSVAGDTNTVWYWSKDGTPIENGGHYSSAHSAGLTLSGFSLADAGNYQGVVSNAFGMATGTVAVVIHCVDAASHTPVPPFLDWSTAATTIQDAIDAAAPYEFVLVTNGVYGTGGKVVAEGLTNRVALDKPLAVTSVNGYAVTIIQGMGLMPTNGPAAVRCAWLAGGAVLNGFTLRGGATHSSGDYLLGLSGGGVWCANTNGLVANCLIATNAAYSWGGGACRAVLNNCTVISNSASVGGGIYQGTANNSLLKGNTSITSPSGAGSHASTLVNCTVVTNYGYGAYQGSCTNCIFFLNAPDYSSASLSFCCALVQASGPGNISAHPRLMSDGFHLSASSPCRGAGTNSVVSGTDLDGQPWANPPSMGCDEWQPTPMFVAQPVAQLATAPLGLSFSSALVTGDTNLFWYWSKDGTPIEDGGRYSSAHAAGLALNGLSLADAGSYQAVVSNAFGMATSAVVHVVLHCVDAAGRASAPPYLSWDTAATNIQDAIDAASPGDFVLVTNGLYATGGKVMAGGLTNRVALDKPVAVTSVNGYAVTTIQGAAILPTNGPSAVRCAWLTNGALLNGFTLRGGATRTGGSDPTIFHGGGAWCAGTNALLANCLLVANSAQGQGGGAYKVMLNNCLVLSNSASQGGGLFQASANNCLLLGNSANTSGGGGAYLSTLVNCTVVSNFNYGVYQGISTNCILYFNAAGNYSGGTQTFCCSTPYPSGLGNIGGDPQLTDGLHLANSSPCRNVGTSNAVTGTDLEGFPWASPPSMGCSEWQPTPLVPVAPLVQFTSSPLGFSLSVTVRGQAPFTCWWTHNGNPIENDPIYSGAHTTNLLVGSLLEGNYQVVVSNSFGMTTSPVRQLLYHYVDAAGRSPTPPYLSWATAATNIQDAISAVAPGEIILVTNGVYGTGGKVMAGDLLNRVVLDKPILVTSVNGYNATIIQGAGIWPTNGTAAIRCVWLTNGAVLNGFALRGGATRTSGDPVTLQSGGGVWCVGTDGAVVNCMLAANAAWYYGGGSYQATFNNCVVFSNSATYGGGGVFQSRLHNCLVTGNSGYGSPICSASTLVNCTVANNFYYGVGTSSCTNSIICFNAYGNYQSGSLAWCCSQPLPSGPGNIGDDPQLTADGFHLSATSPCRGAGATNTAAGVDIDGQPWSNPPSIGCDDWQPVPVLTKLTTARITASPPELTFDTQLSGDTNCVWYWTKAGVPLENGGRVGSAHSGSLTLSGLTPADAGIYQVVVSNAFGMATGAVAVAIHCVDAAGSAPTPPYLDWSTAATNIQDAIDIASANDIVLVTNGLYCYGARDVDLEKNRVVVNKPLSVSSINGPGATVIQGGGLTSPVRCVWMTSGATLNGFTLRGGGTSTLGGKVQSGGGVWCASSNAWVVNCVLDGNAAVSNGGGAYQGTLNNCLILSNSASYGGGACRSLLDNCQLVANSGSYGGGLQLGSATGCLFSGNFGSGCQSSTLLNCTVINNSGGGVYQSACTNCIIYFNPGNNASSSALAYCCTQPLASGPGNLSADPQFLSDGFHLSAISPCRGAGASNLVAGVDLDGQAWGNLPSIGCDEWQPAPFFAAQPRAQLLTSPPLGLRFSSLVTGDTNWLWYWTKDGIPLEDGGRCSSAHTANLSISGLTLADAGAYQVVVSNAFGMATGVVQLGIHCVDAANQAPLSPYLGWSTAATNIQDAIDAAAPYDFVLVTNGIYASGGKALAAGLTNRVALDKPITVTSINGYDSTVIQGTNGPSPVRCAGFVDGAVLNGFTLRGGGTLTYGDEMSARSGGGAWGSENSGLVANCLLTGNSANMYGGGAFGVGLQNCLVVSNSAADSAGGVKRGHSYNCLIAWNTSMWAVVDGGSLVNSTLIMNSAWYATYSCQVTNCIVRFNQHDELYFFDNSSSVAYSCWGTWPPSGPGNISVDPMLVDPTHLAVNSPCRGRGYSPAVRESDIDGEAWANPPSMGCDEVVEPALPGPLSVSLQAPQTLVRLGASLPLTGVIAGRASRVEWSFGDGPVATNLSFFTLHAWAAPGDYTITFTAYNLDHPRGVSTNLAIHVMPQPVADPQSLITTMNTPLPFTLTGSDADNVPLTFSILVPPTNGLVTGAPPAVTYTPNPGYFGADPFTFQVDDGRGCVASAQVSIVVVKTNRPGIPQLAIMPPLNGQPQLTIQGDPYERYCIEASQDLVLWATLTNLIPTNGVFGFIDPDASQYPQRFYRAALQLSLPSITANGLTSSNQFEFSYTGDVGRSYQVLASTNLVNWEVLTNAPATASPLRFQDPNATSHPARFYRVQPAP